MGGVRHAETFFFSFPPPSQDVVVLGLRPYSNYYWCSANAPSEWTDDSNKTNASILCLAYGTTVLSGSSQHNPRCLICVAKQRVRRTSERHREKKFLVVVVVVFVRFLSGIFAATATAPRRIIAQRRIPPRKEFRIWPTQRSTAIVYP